MQKIIEGALRETRAARSNILSGVLERAFRVAILPLEGVCSRSTSRSERDLSTTACAPISSLMLATSCARRLPDRRLHRDPAALLADEKARESFLQIMQTQTSRMARLIDDLLSLSRIEMKPFARTGEKIDIGEIVGSVVESLNHLAQDLGVTVNFEPPKEKMLAPANRDELIQVLVNLLENACKYGQSGQRVDVSIDLSSDGPTPEVTVTIRDYGPGIAEEHIPRITERFYRIDGETSRVKNGTGLGLAIVKHILTRHEGRLSVHHVLARVQVSPFTCQPSDLSQICSMLFLSSG